MKMNSTGTKKVLKGAAAAAGFVLVLFAPTGCLVTGTTAGTTTGGTLGGTTGGTVGGTVGGAIGGIVGGITGALGGL
ncbi:putative membrane protein [Mycobacterium avium MAV_120709_2344]|nr:putative membrane protein [Mycobacterium avium MAV_120709_2344]